MCHIKNTRSRNVTTSASSCIHNCAELYTRARKLENTVLGSCCCWRSSGLGSGRTFHECHHNAKHARICSIANLMYSMTAYVKMTNSQWAQCFRRRVATAIHSACCSTPEQMVRNGRYEKRKRFNGLILVSSVIETWWKSLISVSSCLLCVIDNMRPW